MLKDPLLGEKLAECFEKKVLGYNTQASHVSYDSNGFSLETNEGTLIAEKLLISTGRHANTGKLGLENVGVETNQKWIAIVVNSMMETSQLTFMPLEIAPNMPQFVYVAAAAGSRAGINMTGGNAQLDLSHACCYIHRPTSCYGRSNRSTSFSGRNKYDKSCT